MSKRIPFTHVALLALMSLFIAVIPALAQNPTPTPLSLGPTMTTLRSRNQLICGVNQDALGLGYLDPNSGDVIGLQVDLCRALAAALFGDAAAVQFPPYSNTNVAMNALKSGEVDLLIRDIPWSFSQDASGLEFGPPIFYTGQGIMVQAEGGAANWSELNSKTVCVVAGSTAEAAIPAAAARQNISLQIISPASTTLQAAWQNFQEGRCDALSAERVQLLILQKRSNTPQSFIVWNAPDQIYTHEPYAPILRNDDEQWANIVRWTMLGLVQAEQLGITSETVETYVRQVNTSTNTPETDTAYLERVGAERARFLDELLGIGAQLGLAPDFMRPAIIAVGNYGEIYNRHFGAQGDLTLPRGLNNLADVGGMMYAPDWR